MPGNPDAYVTATYNTTVGRRRPIKGRGQRQAAGGPGDAWPLQLNLKSLAGPNRAANPLGDDFDYCTEFLSVDLEALARDVDEALTTSQSWWPADFGHYGPLVLRMAWHSAGTYRATDGRGGGSAGMLRFAPLNSWPDNRHLDKARRLLWPVKKKYGAKISWADLMIFAGNRALESMGFTTFGFAGGREEVWGADDTYWGPEHQWLADERHSGIRDLDEPLAAVEMGLIYVDPQGPATVPDPIASARDIRQTFARMGLNDQETVALIAGGHTFGKTHGVAGRGTNDLGPEPEAAPFEAQGLGWANPYGTGNGADTINSGLEGIWTPTPTRWDNSYLETLFGYEWDVTLSPAGLWQWIPRDGAGCGTVPDPYDPSKTHAPTVLTIDLALREDRRYEPIARRFLQDPDQMADAFARAWYKITHLDMGPTQRYLGTLVPSEQLIWQDPLPAVDHELVAADNIAVLKSRLFDSGLSVVELVRTAWASASTYRNSDKRGGANGARIRLEPQLRWDVNEPEALAQVLGALEQLREQFNESQNGPVKISLADLIVLGGCAAVEAAAASAGHHIEVPFRPGRTDATQEWTDPDWFAVLEPTADGFRNYLGSGNRLAPELLLIDRAHQLTLSAREMTVLLGGLRAIGINHGPSPVGVLTPTPGSLTNDFFVHLLDVDTVWTPKPDAASQTTYEGRDRRTGELKWVASRTDLVFGANSELRELSEFYASQHAEETFVGDFVSAWDKVMNLDMFDRH